MILDTLAQSGTKKLKDTRRNPVTVCGNGSDLSDEKLQKGKCKKKITTKILALNLIKVAKAKGEPELIPSLLNTYRCGDIIYTSNGRAYMQYCKNRFCTICLGIRKAEMIRKYYPVLKEWESPFFLTLTIKSVTSGLIKHQIHIMNKAFNTIVARYKKRHQRGKGIKFMGVKSTECNFRPDKKTYNVHFHLILPNLKTADTLMREWRLYWNDPNIVEKGAQYNRRVKNLEEDLVEIIKYGTKIFTVPDVQKKIKGKGHEKIYVAAFYNIIKGMQGERLYSSFGFNLPKEKSREIRKTIELSDCEEYNYDEKLFDWKNTSTGEKLLKQLPDAKFLNYLMQDRIDLTTE